MGLVQWARLAKKGAINIQGLINQLQNYFPQVYEPQLIFHCKMPLNFSQSYVLFFKLRLSLTVTDKAYDGQPTPAGEIQVCYESSF